MKNLKSENKKWLYVSLRYYKILNRVEFDYISNKYIIENKSKVNSLYGDLVYKSNFLIYGNEEKIKEIQEKHKNELELWVSCDEYTKRYLQLNYFDYLNFDKLNKKYCYVNFFESDIENFKFKIESESEEDFFNKFFNLCEKSINEENKTLYDLLNKGVIEKITTNEDKLKIQNKNCKYS